MKVLKNSILLLALCLYFSLNSCGHDDEVENVLNTFGSYSLTIKIKETKPDQDLVLTSIEYVDYKGNKVKDYVTVNEDKEYTLTTHAFTKVPATSIIAINQELSNKVDYDQQNFSFGMLIEASIESTDVSGNTINVRKVQDERNTVCTQSQLKSNFPRTINIKYSVDKSGAVTLSID